MAVAVKTRVRYTPEEYLALEEAAEYKSEYYQGEIFPMTGGTINHNRITRNALTLLTTALHASLCEAFGSDMRLWVSVPGLFTYPDLMVLCGQPQFYQKRRDTILNPTVIVEVLSPSTQTYDRGEKFQFYRSLPTLRDYLLIHQAAIHVEHYTRLTNGNWVLQESQAAEGKIEINSLKLELPLGQLYERVDWALNE